MMSQFHKLAIKAIQHVTDKAVTISFNIPADLKDYFSFKAGQYITLKTQINDQEIRRDYSLCSSPKSGDITVAVKEVQDGTFSTYAKQSLKVGDTIEVSKPNGRFTFEPNASETRTITAFAAGSGITPVMSIAKTLLEEEPNSKFILVYGNKTTNDTIFFDELLDLQSQYQERFAVQFVFSQAEEDNSLFGRIDQSTVNFIIKNKHKDITIDAFYLCGPEAMIHTVTDVLKEHGVAESKISFELFTATASTESPTETMSNGNAQVKVLVDDEEFSFEMSQKQTILEAALAQDIDAPYSCQGGICSSCIGRLTEGQATMRKNNILTDSELAEGLILTCQAHPTTAKVVVDFDDV